MGRQLNQKTFFRNGEMTTVLLQEKKCKIVWSWDDVSKDMQETLWGFIKEHYIFPSEQEKIGKNATMKTIYNAF
jgi:hypothetical protein